MKGLRYIWEELNASFWFIPVLMLLLAVVSAVGFIYLDSIVEYSPKGIWVYLLAESVESARSILTIIAGAMIGVAGTVFSITLVVLTLASSQLGSRIVRKFMYDRLNQIVLGSYVSSFVYCLIVLSSLTIDESQYFVPSFSVFAALLAAVAGIILLIVFIHHVSMSIQSDKVISDISDSMSKSIRILFPDEIGHEDKKPAPDVDALKKEYELIDKVKCRKSGYLESVDGDGLVQIAEENDCIIILKHRPGDYLVKEMVLCEILCKEQCDDDVHKKFHNYFIIGKVRTPLQDAEFSIHQLVEVASKALSPGVNDPYTAIACVDNLNSVMCYLTGVQFPSSYRYDSEGKLRIIADHHTFAGMLNTAFNQIRQYAEGSPSVMIRLMEAMVNLNSFARTTHQKKQIFEHAEMIMKAAERTFHESRDLEDIKKRYSILTETKSN